MPAFLGECAHKSLGTNARTCKHKYSNACAHTASPPTKTQADAYTDKHLKTHTHTCTHAHTHARTTRKRTVRSSPSGCPAHWRRRPRSRRSEGSSNTSQRRSACSSSSSSRLAVRTSWQKGMVLRAGRASSTVGGAHCRSSQPRHAATPHGQGMQQHHTAKACSNTTRPRHAATPHGQGMQRHHTAKACSNTTRPPCSARHAPYAVNGFCLPLHACARKAMPNLTHTHPPIRVPIFVAIPSPTSARARAHAYALRTCSQR